MVVSLIKFLWRYDNIGVDPPAPQTHIHQVISSATYRKYANVSTNLLFTVFTLSCVLCNGWRPRLSPPNHAITMLQNQGNNWNKFPKLKFTGALISHAGKIILLNQRIKKGNEFEKESMFTTHNFQAFKLTIILQWQFQKIEQKVWVLEDVVFMLKEPTCVHSSLQ